MKISSIEKGLMACCSNDFDQCEAMKVMGEVLEGICGMQHVGIKKCWLIRRHGNYWPSVMQDYISYVKGCQACQRHANIHHAPVIKL